jgi:crotonobetainyl-CoA:carnitine CoA-transferase CaiB-like acyl-CoA transferase
VTTDADREPWPLDPLGRGTGLPLEGVRVLDFSRVLAGPLCAMVAGDLGADVIKVESPEGDPVRTLAPPRYGEDATYYLAVNRNRRNVVADLREPAQYAAIAALVARADAVVENFLPSQAVALGIDRLRASNPDCVWVTVAPAASGGPLADQPTFDLLAQARSGLMGVTGEPTGPPTKVGAPVADVIAGLYGAVGLLAGLFARVSGRAGRHFEAPLLESAISALVNQAQGYLATGIAPGRLGNDHPSITPYGPVTTADGELLLAVGTDAQYARLVEALDDDELRRHREFDLNDGRVAGRAALRSMLDRIFATRASEEWSELLRAAGVPHAPILDVAGALAQPQVRDGDLLGVTDAPAGALTMVRSPLRVDGERPPIRLGPRRLGEDSARFGL